MNAEHAEKKNGLREMTIAEHRRSTKRVIDHIRANLAESHTTKSMAQIACLSPFHFTRIFHEITGLPPIEYLFATRVTEARRLGGATAGYRSKREDGGCLPARRY